MRSETTAAAFITHTAEEVSRLSDEQVLILWQAAHKWVVEANGILANGHRQLAAVEIEIKRRGIKPDPIILT